MLKQNGKNAKFWFRRLKLGSGFFSLSGTAGILNPGPWTGTDPWPVRNGSAQREVSGWQVSKASSVFTSAPHCSHCCLSSAFYQINSVLPQMWTLLWTEHTRDLGCILLMGINPQTTHPPLTLVHGKIVFHKTGPSCQKGWRLLWYSMVLFYAIWIKVLNIKY